MMIRGSFRKESKSGNRMIKREFILELIVLLIQIACLYEIYEAIKLGVAKTGSPENCHV